MQNKKKIISVILALIIALSAWSIVPFTANAAEVKIAATAETEGDYDYDVLDDGTAEITGYTGEGGDITIPSTLGGYTVSRIGYVAFAECSSLTSIDIPDSVTSIGDLAFFNCRGLTSVTIGNSVTSIGDEAFRYCTGLTSVTIGNSVTSIGDEAFSYCTGLTSVTIGNSITSIGWAAFYGCTGLTSVTIPDSVTTIGLSAFANTAWYDNQPDGIIYAGKVAYEMKGSGPSEVVIKDGTLSIAQNVFYCCEELTNVTIPDSVTSIGWAAFYGCTGLTSIDIPDSVTSIDDKAFFGCRGLTRIIIPNSVTSIGKGMFSFCEGLTSIDIPDSVTSIGDSAFDGCTGLTSITIPDSVTSIGNRAFGYYYDESNYEHKIDGFTIYGYEGSEAEKYAKDNEFTFVPLKSKTDEATGIILDIPEDTDLTVKDITAEIVCDLPDGCNKMTAYDISLTKDGEAVQPENIVTVKIPCANENAKVYRFETDGKMTDMNAKYKDGYMVFTTDHFSIYVLAEPKPAGVTVSGAITSYVDDSDVTVKLTGADNNFTAETNGKADYSIEAVPAGKYTLTVSKANHVTREYTVTVSDTNVTQDVKACPKGDVNGDGETDIMDCSVAQRYIRELTDLDAYQIACGDVSGTGDGELDIQDVSRILRHIRELAMLY